MEEILRTSRLWLRPLTPEDTDSLCQIMQDPEAMTAYERCYSRQEVQQWIARNQKRYQTDGAGLWAVILTESGILIGQCGLVWQQEAGMAFWEVGNICSTANIGTKAMPPKRLWPAGTMPLPT